MIQELTKTVEEEHEKKDQEIYELKEQMNKIQEAFKLYAAHANELTKEVFEKIKQQERKQKEENERRKVLYDMLDKQLPGWGEKYYKLLGIGGRPLTKEEREKVEQMLEWLRKNPDTDNAEDID